MGERYVRPPLLAREPAPRWLAVWRFRLIVVLLIIALAVAGVLTYRAFVESTEQDPGIPITLTR